jgi:hypothetical protein
MEIAALTAFLAPLLGDLLGDLAGRAKTSVGDAVWEQGRKLWARLRPKVDDDAAAAAAAKQLAANPADPGAQARLTVLLSEILDANPDVKRALTEEWQAARDAPATATAIASAERSVALAGHNVGNWINTGDAPPPPRE